MFEAVVTGLSWAVACAMLLISAVGAQHLREDWALEDPDDRVFGVPLVATGLLAGLLLLYWSSQGFGTGVVW